MRTIGRLRRALILAMALILALGTAWAARGEGLPAPGEDLSFLAGYADAARVGDWFLACQAATAPDDLHDSPTRNATARWALLDGAGNVLAEDLYWWPAEDAWPLHPRPFEGFQDGVDAAVIRVGQRYGLIDRSGRIVVPPVYDDIFGFEPGDTCTPVKQNGLWGAVDGLGNLVVPVRYDASFPRFEGGCTVAERGGKYALLGQDGVELLPAAYDLIWLESGAACGMARAGGVCQMIDRTGKILFELELGEDGWIDCYADAVAPFGCYDGNTGKHFFVNPDGTRAFPGEFDDAWYFTARRDTAFVSVGGRYGLIRRDGSFAIPAEYDWVGSFSGGLVLAQRGGLWGYLDEAGAVAIPFQFAGAEDFQNGYADAVPADAENADDASALPQRHGLIDRTGAWVVAPGDCSHVACGPDGVAVAGDMMWPTAFYRLTGGAAQPVAGLFRSAEWVCDDQRPHEDASGLAALDGEKTLKKRVSDSDRLPHLDGEARLYPLFAAYVQAVYPKDVVFEAWDEGENPTLTLSGEDNPWQRLSDGDADIIFAADPGPEASIWATLAARGQSLRFIPLCRDAVVFPVNADNPVDDLTRAELQAVFAGQIDEWSALGGWPGQITAYQDGADSPATAAFEALCGFGELADAPLGVCGWDGFDQSPDIGPVAYRNLPGAVGYALRSACGDLLASGAVRLLAVDGVAPTDEAIADGSYPFTQTLYAVTLAGNDNPNVLALLDWITSAQGKELAGKNGFVGMRN